MSIVRLRILLLYILYFHVTLFAVPHVSIFTRLQMMKAVEFLYLSTFWAPFHPRNHGFSFLSAYGRALAGKKPEKSA